MAAPPSGDVRAAAGKGSVGEAEPRWFYIGNGQLRKKDSDGWTDEYRDVDGPKKTSAVGPDASPDHLAPVTGKPARRTGERLSSFIRLCAVAVSRPILGLYHLIGSRSRPISVKSQEPPAGASSRAAARHRGSGSTSGTAKDGLSGLTRRSGLEQPPMHLIRRVGAAVLILAAFGVWFGMRPASSDTSAGYQDAISTVVAVDAANAKKTQGEAQQAVLSDRTMKDLLTIIARQGADPRPVDERPAALFTLLLLGFGFGLGTTRLPVRQPAMSSPAVSESGLTSPSVLETSPVVSAAPTG